MNTLRKLVINLRDAAASRSPSVMEAALWNSSDELSAEIPKWERLFKAADRAAIQLAGSGTVNANDFDELLAALSEVRHD